MPPKGFYRASTGAYEDFQVFGIDAIRALKAERGADFKKLYPRAGEGCLDRSHLVRRLANSVRIGDSGCWEWQLRTNGVEYGTLTVGGRSVYAHRLAFDLSEKGPLPPEGVVMHLCDNPRCVNPGHLQHGTQEDNMQDALAKGRVPLVLGNCGLFGENHPAAKLTEADVLEIARRVDLGNQRHSDIATEFGVTQSMVSRIGRREAWTHLFDSEAA